MNLEIYNLTGEIVYLDEMEVEELNKEVEKRVAKMRVEITTVEQFRAIGNAEKVGYKYGVGRSTAAKLLTDLLKATPSPSESPYIEPEELAKWNPTTEVENAPPAVNLSEREKFFEEVEPDLSAVAGMIGTTHVKPANRFSQILDPVADLLDRKNRDYGNSYDQLRGEFGKPAFIIRLADKFNRLKTLAKQDALVKDESEVDTIRDIIGYCTLELAFREREAQK